MTDIVFYSLLMKHVLRRYAHGVLPTSVAPGRGPALEAVMAATSDKLLRIACDVWSISFGELSRTAKVGQTSISSFVMGTSALTNLERKALLEALDSIVSELSR